MAIEKKIVFVDNGETEYPCKKCCFGEECGEVYTKMTQVGLKDCCDTSSAYYAVEVSEVFNSGGAIPTFSQALKSIVDK